MIRVGRILRAHGVKGEVVVASESDSPDRFVAGTSFLTDSGRSLTVSAIRLHHGRLLATLEGITDRDLADALRDTVLYIPAEERRQLSAEEYWPEDLEGLEVRDRHGRHLGTIESVVVGSAQDRLTVRFSGQLVDVPFVKELVPEVHLEAGYVTVEPIEGLFSSEPD